jgi:hypothetical protein
MITKDQNDILCFKINDVYNYKLDKEFLWNWFIDNDLAELSDFDKAKKIVDKFKRSFRTAGHDDLADEMVNLGKLIDKIGK